MEIKLRFDAVPEAELTKEQAGLALRILKERGFAENTAKVLIKNPDFIDGFIKAQKDIFKKIEEAGLEINEFCIMCGGEKPTMPIKVKNKKGKKVTKLVCGYCYFKHELDKEDENGQE